MSYYHVTQEFQSESTHYSLPECQGTSCSKQASHLKFKKLLKNSVKKLLFVTRHVSDWCKTQQMCDKVVDNYPHALKFVPDCYMTQNMCTRQFVLEYYKNQIRCDKAVNRYFLYLLLFMTGINSRNVWQSCFWRSFFS